MAESVRLDGRALTDVRPIWTEVDYLPSAHGSAIFNRGETQSLTSAIIRTVWSLTARRGSAPAANLELSRVFLFIFVRSVIRCKDVGLFFFFVTLLLFSVRGLSR